MKFVISIFAIIAALSFFSQPSFAAETISAGDLIKASGPAVYYYGADGKRYVFPTEKTYLSWYQNFDAVKTISDTDLAAIMIGGNVTYRPGVRMVKITTDPKTYAVDSHGTIRHITSEEVAVNLYGENWNTKIDDIPDPFFINYTLGNPINSSSDFNPANALAVALSINTDKQITGTPSQPEEPQEPEVPAEPGTMSFSVSQSTPRPGDELTFTVNANQAEGVSQIKILLEGGLLMTCNNTTVCTVNYQVPLITDKTSLLARAETIFINQTEQNREITIQVKENTVANGVHIYADRTSVKVGQSTGVTVDAPDIVVKRIELFVDNAGQKVCESGIRTCQLSVTPGGGIGTSVTVHGLVTDNLGRTYRSKDLMITVAQNDSPLITIQADKNTIYTGETVNITVAASDQDGIKSIEILDPNRQIMKHCEGAAPCTYAVGPWEQTGTYTFYGRATDLLDGADEQSTNITIVNP